MWDNGPTWHGPCDYPRAVGWGQEKPIADNRSEEGRAKNRRVEIIKK